LDDEIEKTLPELFVVIATLCFVLSCCATLTISF